MAESVSNNKIYDRLMDVSVALARVEGRIQNVEASNAELIKVVIKGNGHLPLTRRVQELEDWHCAEDATKEQAKSDVKEKKKKWGDRSWAFIMLFLAQLVIWLFLFLKTLP